MTISVFLVDDHPAFRDGLRVALDTTETIKVVGEADTGEEAVRLLPALDPSADVVLMDIKLTGCSGIAATRLITADATATKVLIVSAADDADITIGALRAGARGFIDKSVCREDLLRSIHIVARGGAVFGARTVAQLDNYFSKLHRPPPQLAFPELSDRETQVLDLLAHGHDNRRIARELVLAEKTVRNHVTQILMKLRVPDRTAAAVRARDAGLGRAGTKSQALDAI